MVASVSGMRGRGVLGGEGGAYRRKPVPRQVDKARRTHADPLSLWVLLSSSLPPSFVPFLCHVSYYVATSFQFRSCHLCAACPWTRGRISVEGFKKKVMKTQPRVAMAVRGRVSCLLSAWQLRVLSDRVMSISSNASRFPPPQGCGTRKTRCLRLTKECAAVAIGGRRLGPKWCAGSFSAATYCASAFCLLLFNTPSHCSVSAAPFSLSVARVLCI